MSVLKAIGNTPIIELTNVNSRSSKVRILCKLEGNNPGGSIKDRPAYYMIQKAEETGQLKKGTGILESTSGNTGIALAMIGAAKGYSVTLVMPACVSAERSRILEAFGAEVILSPSEESTDGAIKKAYQIMENNPGKYYMPDQFSNENNTRAHYETTGPEIYQQTGGDIDVLVAGMGTTGTLMGTSQYLKEQNPRISIVGVEPSQGHSIQGLKNMDEAIVPQVYRPQLLDEKINIGDEEAFQIARTMAIHEGVFVGMSSGAAVAGALQVAKNMDAGTVLCILPDRGDRYLSTTLFRSICAECAP